MTTQSLASALAPSGRFVKWENASQTITGTVQSVDIRQATKFGTTEPDTWDNGDPKMQALVRVETSEQADPDDDGMRTIVINLWSGQKKALAAACKAAGVAEPKPGDGFTATWVDGAGTAASPRQFMYVIKPGPGEVANALGTTAGDAESNVVKLIAAGMDDATIAAAAGVDEATVQALRDEPPF